MIILAIDLSARRDSACTMMCASLCQSGAKNGAPMM